MRTLLPITLPTTKPGLGWNPSSTRALAPRGVQTRAQLGTRLAASAMWWLRPPQPVYISVQFKCVFPWFHGNNTKTVSTLATNTNKQVSQAAVGAIYKPRHQNMPSSPVASSMLPLSGQAGCPPGVLAPQTWPPAAW